MLAGIEALLKEVIGLDAATIGTTALGRAVRLRQAACGIAATDDYLAHLRGSAAEVQELIDTVVVPETWFFRDRGAFSAMTQILRDAPPRDGRPFRLLSLPCSTGEEPYSISMALLDAGFAPEQVAIDGMDVSARSIALAERAIYGQNAFRGGELGFRDRHFEPVPGGFRPLEAVRRQVRFTRGNLFDAVLPAGTYDVVFCRNLLIYFDRPTQDAAIQAVHRLLVPGGTLFLGPSETALPPRQDFTWMKLPMAFAFRKATIVPAAPLPAPPRPVVATPARLARKPAAPAPPPRLVPPAPLPPVAPVRAAEAAALHPDLLEARRLADAGRLAEAVQRCENHVREKGPSAEAFHLLGLLHDAAGRGGEAVAQYRKALYLQPYHQEALAHLALLLEQQGDGAGARMIRDRLQRAASRGVRSP
jgi:chemotaxis protein methyltransferase WspC